MTDSALFDCEMFSDSTHRCVALKNTYCRFEEECSFYKPRGVNADNTGEDTSKTETDVSPLLHIL